MARRARIRALSDPKVRPSYSSLSMDLTKPWVLLDNSEERFQPYKNCTARLESFPDNWSLMCPVDRVSLAEAGLYSLGDGDKVQCAFCRGKFYNWGPEDEAFTEHAKHFPRCKFVREKLQATAAATTSRRTVPVDAESSNDLHGRMSYRFTELFELSLNRFLAENKERITQLTATALSKPREERESMTISPTKAQHDELPGYMSPTCHHNNQVEPGEPARQLQSRPFWYSPSQWHEYSDVGVPTPTGRFDNSHIRRDHPIPRRDSWETSHHMSVEESTDPRRQTLSRSERKMRQQEHMKNASYILEASVRADDRFCGISTQQQEELPEFVESIGAKQETEHLQTAQDMEASPRQATRSAITHSSPENRESDFAHCPSSTNSNLGLLLEPSDETPLSCFKRKQRSQRVYGKKENGSAKRHNTCLYCLYCEENEANMIFLPCRHFVCCMSCAEMCELCVSCNSPITGCVKMRQNGEERLYAFRGTSTIIGLQPED